jgi:hypothetical protein
MHEQIPQGAVAFLFSGDCVSLNIPLPVRVNDFIQESDEGGKISTRIRHR